MPRLLVHDAGLRAGLLPLTYFKPVGDLRVGILTQAESWALALGHRSFEYVTDATLQGLYPVHEGDFLPDDLVVNAGVVATGRIVEAVRSLRPGQALFAGTRWIASLHAAPSTDFQAGARIELDVPSPWAITFPWDLFLLSETAIEADFERLTQSRSSQPLSPTVRVIGGGRIFLEKGAQAEACTLNASQGPIFLGQDTEIMEGSCIRGPFALGQGSMVKMGARIYGATSIGPGCRVGGEVQNTVMQSFSNKGHDGFLGNSVIGSWCNLGADTNSSNLRNDYGQIRAWSIDQNTFVRTSLQFCGLIMGDHSKTGIHTMLNTATVVGAFCNVFGSGFPRAWIPPFSWGGAHGFTPHPLARALETARVVMARRGQVPSEDFERLASALHQDTHPNA